MSVKDAVRDRWRDANTRWEAEGRRRGGLVFRLRLGYSMGIGFPLEARHASIALGNPCTVEYTTYDF